MRLQSHPIRTVRGAWHFFTAARAVSGATLLRLVLLRTSRSFVRFSLPCTHARGHARIVNNASPSTLSWTPLFSSWNTRNGKLPFAQFRLRVRSLHDAGSRLGRLNGFMVIIHERSRLVDLNDLEMCWRWVRNLFLFFFFF